MPEVPGDEGLTDGPIPGKLPMETTIEGCLGSSGMVRLVLRRSVTVLVVTEVTCGSSDVGLGADDVDGSVNLLFCLEAKKRKS